jgi:hypothetical protein
MKKDTKASGMGACTDRSICLAVVVETEGREGVEIAIIASLKEFDGGPIEMLVRGSIRAWLGGKKVASVAFGVVD